MQPARATTRLTGMLVAAAMCGCASAEDGGGRLVGSVADEEPDGGDGSTEDGAASETGGETGAPDATEFSPAQIQFYLARIAPRVAGRSLTAAESEEIEALGAASLEPIIDRWLAEPGFAEAMRQVVAELLQASGQRDGIDFELPGNLAAQIATDDLPWSTILTADYCVDATGNHIPCDTGAPYQAGVLATRAYLVANTGRFNLGRAKQMLEVFACRVYPMEPDIQVPLARETLIPMFQAQTAEEQTVEEAKGGFGNGAGCYSCHSQFGAHAQLYVKFDDTGLWRGDASGQQDPAGELGRSYDGLFTSHMIDPAAAASETSQMFGQNVANLRDAAEVIAYHPLFTACTAKNLLAKTFGLRAGHTDDIDEALVDALGDEINALDPDPTLRQIVRTIFTNERVVAAVIEAMEETER